MIKTLVLQGGEAITLAGKMLRRGELVAIPTETVYGLAANALDPDAVARIFAVKGRPQDNPLIVHVASAKALPELVSSQPDDALRLAEAFWPGPLTLVLPRSARVPDIVTAGLDTVAVRCPGSEIARDIIREAGVPLAAPSANLSGRPSPTCAEHVLHDLNGMIGLILDGGACEVGVESTVLDLGSRCVLRPGGITREALEAVIGPLHDPQALSGEGAPRAPGMKYRHYAPRAPLVIVHGAVERAADYVRGHVPDGKVGVLCFDEEARFFSDSAEVICYGKRADAAGQARSLFGALRRLDEAGVALICARCPEGEGAFAAVANRLHKASGSVIYL